MKVAAILVMPVFLTMVLGGTQEPNSMARISASDDGPREGIAKMRVNISGLLKKIEKNLDGAVKGKLCNVGLVENSLRVKSQALTQINDEYNRWWLSINRQYEDIRHIMNSIEKTDKLIWKMNKQVRRLKNMAGCKADASAQKYIEAMERKASDLSDENARCMEQINSLEDRVDALQQFVISKINILQ